MGGVSRPGRQARRIAWALAYADGWDIDGASEHCLPADRWVPYLEQAVEIVADLDAFGDAAPPSSPGGSHA